MKYKVLTLTQPWATLVAIGAKKNETRSWSTSHRGPLLIHAAAGLGPVGGWRGLRDLAFGRHEFRNALYAGLFGDNAVTPDALEAALPRGAIVAVAELRDVARIERYEDEEWSGTVLNFGSRMDYGPDDGEPERAFGDYTPGRYAWLLDNVRRLPEPIPARGQLGLWEWEGTIGV